MRMSVDLPAQGPGPGPGVVKESVKLALAVTAGLVRCRANHVIFHVLELIYSPFF